MKHKGVMEMNYPERLFYFDNLFGNGQMKVSAGEILQVSELSLVRGAQISLHNQICDEITYAILGSAVFVSGDEKNEVKAGQVHFIKKGCLHKIEASQDENFRFLCIGYNPNYEDDGVRSFYEAVNRKDCFIADDDGTVKALSVLLIREFYNFDEFSSRMINHYVSQIFISLTRILSGKSFVKHNNHGERSASFAIYKMLRYIDREYLQIQRVKEIASALSYSEYYLSHLFKEKMGMTIKEYLTKKKIAYSTELLNTTELTMEQIADQLGFSCPYSFRRAFKKYVGLTPGDYKRNSNFCSPK